MNESDNRLCKLHRTTVSTGELKKNLLDCKNPNDFTNELCSIRRNFAIERDSKSTVVAGTAGQNYIDNIFSNPDNDYEMITVNSSL